MKQGGLLSAFLAVVVSTACSAAGQNDAGKTGPAGADSALVGDWRGESICVVRESACRDEDSLYHVTPMPEKAGRFLLKADKIVDGKPITMGTSECEYDSKQHVLECRISTGSVLRFTIDGHSMQGTMTLADKRLWRKITLKKVS
jgi:hypothetical protein